jgi:hypothetical protein
MRHLTTGAERRWLALASAAILVVTVLPLGAAAAVAPRDSVFSGFVVEARDGVSYVAKTMEGVEGHWTYHDPYTSEPHPTSLIYVPYLLLGQLDRVLQLPLPVLLQLARLVLGAALLWAVYALCVECFAEVGMRRLGFMLAVLGGGIGIVAHANILGYHLVSLDRAVSGTQGLETLSVAPHILLACLASVWLALIWVRHGAAPRLMDAFGALAWTLVMSSAYPQLAAMWAVAAAAGWALQRSRGHLYMFLVIAAGAAPYLVYGLSLRAGNPIFAAWPPQSDIDIGDPLSLLLWGHLVMLPFVLVAAAEVAARRASPVLELMLLWVIAAAVLMYAPGLPHVLQRVYYGSFVPWALLAAAGIAIVRARAAPPRRRLVRGAVPLMAVAGIAAAAESFAIPLQHVDDHALYFPRDESTVLEALRGDRPTGGGVVMNSFLSGLFVPAVSGQTTYVGFPFETIDATRKQGDAVAFYGLGDGVLLRQRAADLHLDYVLYGRYERDLGGAGRPAPGVLAGWEVVARRGDAVVYRVTR